MKLQFALIFLFISNHTYGQAYEKQCIDVNSPQFSSQPEISSNYWKQELSKTYDAIPNPSPADEKWIQEELASGNAERQLRAMRSKEYSIYKSKRILKYQLSLLNADSGNSAILIKSWSFFASSLMTSDIQILLERLINQKIIKSESLPNNWKADSFGTSVADSAKLDINISTSHILECIIPSLVDNINKSQVKKSSKG